MIWLLAQVVFEGPELLKGEGPAAKTPPRVEIALFEGLPEARGLLWSSWGDGCLASNGKYYTSIGDHGGVGATSKVYEYDGKLREIVDVAKALGLKPDEFGHGKIHAAIHEWEGALWFATYWGKSKGIPDDWGGVLFRYENGKLENLGILAKGRGFPASVLDRGLLYFHSVSPGEGGELLVYDLAARKVRFTGGADLLEGKRAFLRDAEGRVYLGAKQGLARFDPATNRLEKTSLEIPGMLRAGARPAKDGRMFGMTEKGRLFVIDREVRDLGPNWGDGDYTAVMVLSPDEKYLYYAPGAHGSATRHGTPVVQYEIATGKRKALCFLLEPVRKRLTYTVGGCYNLRIDPGGERLYLTCNGAPYVEGARKPETFGRPCVAVVQIPASER